jgi:hypothetical protein
MKKYIIITVATMVLALGFAGTSSAAVIKPLKELPENIY